MAFDANDPDTKAAIEAITAPLVAKNAEVLRELKEARKGKTIDPAELEKLETRIDSLTAELTTAQKTAKDATKAAEIATKAHADESGFTSRLLIDNGLVSELTKHGVTNPISLKAAQAMLRSGVAISADGDNRVAKVGDKALSDYVKEWAASDEGKHFVTAPANSGGGANGGGSGGSSVDTSKMSAQQKMDAGRKT